MVLAQLAAIPTQVGAIAGCVHREERRENMNWHDISGNTINFHSTIVFYVVRQRVMVLTGQQISDYFFCHVLCFQLVSIFCVPGPNRTK